MTNDELYHASHDDLQEGDCVTTEGLPSNYWSRLFDAGVVGHQDWGNVRTEASPQNQRFIADKYHFRSQSLKEMAFEVHRLECYPERPSRKACRFLMETPLSWREPLANGDGTRHLYQARLVQAERQFVGDAKWLGNNTSSFAEFTQRADDYWAGKATSNPLWETLFEGTFEITSKVDGPAEAKA